MVQLQREISTKKEKDERVSVVYQEPAAGPTGLHLFYIRAVRLRRDFVKCLLNGFHSIWGPGPEKDSFAAKDAFSTNKHSFLLNKINRSIYLVPSDFNSLRDLEEASLPPSVVQSNATNWSQVEEEGGL